MRGGIGLKPCWGMAPWAMRPQEVILTRSAPFWAMQTSPASGSQMMAASTPLARPLATRFLTPIINPSSSTSAATTIFPGKGPVSSSRRAANSIAATPLFMSAEPRP